MVKLIGHHACRNTGNGLQIEKSGLPIAVSTYNPTNSKNPFLGSGYYFWDYNIRMAKYWGKSHYDNKFYIFQADIPYNENTLLDLVGNRQHIEWLVDLMDDFKEANEGNAHWNIGTFIEFLKEIAEEEGYSDVFPFKSVRAIDHSASIPNVEYYFDGQSKAYITLNPRIIICIIDANPLTLQNLKLIYQK
jgi:hypothetical protein